MFTSIYILNFKGHVLYSNIFRPEQSPNHLHIFLMKILCFRGISNHPPVNKVEGIDFIHMVINQGLVMMGVVSEDSNIMACFEYFRSIKCLIFEVCGEISQEAILKHKSDLGHILEETMIHGYPQITFSKALKNFKDDILTKKQNTKNCCPITKQLTSTVFWRTTDILYPVENMFLTVVETVNAVISKNGKEF
ncbi:AP-2 complex subunit mu [Thelohanellus kitauei]|uniref:AP-2 complex subunit mu n=1 Tax=Thelohanellus kitauei TaxID=669202 RepID=A0A0C2MX62_THEKT|nr:AP-2 complex subunit mu [Thelohanellus kitauei]